MNKSMRFRALALCLLLAAGVVSSACAPIDYISSLACNEDSIPTGIIDGVEVRCQNGFYLPVK